MKSGFLECSPAQFVEEAIGRVDEMYVGHSESFVVWLATSQQYLGSWNKETGQASSASRKPKLSAAPSEGIAVFLSPETAVWDEIRTPISLDREVKPVFYQLR